MKKKKKYILIIIYAMVCFMAGWGMMDVALQIKRKKTEEPIKKMENSALKPDDYDELDIEEIIILAYEENDIKALAELADRYMSGQDVKQDKVRALEILESVDYTSDAAIAFELGVYYYNDDEEKDYEKALSYYRTAAELGNGNAQLNLGYMYAMGYGCNQNYEKSVEYTLMATENEFYEAAREKAFYNMGNKYEHGNGVEQSYEKAMEYYELAAKTGHPRAEYSIGRLYYEGMGEDGLNYEVAKYWLKKSEYDDYKFRLAYIAASEGNGPNAIYLYKRVGDKDKGSEYYNMAFCYMEEKGVLVNDELIVSLFDTAATKYQHKNSCIWLGIIYRDGLYGVQTDKTIAKQWFDKAQEYGADVTEYLSSL